MSRWWKQVFSRTPLSFQVQHLGNLCVFLALGKLNAHMGVTWWEVAATAAAAVATEAAGRRLTGWRSTHFPVPSLVTAFAVCMILRGASPWVLPLATAVGIASKYLLRAGGAHFHNPSNVAVLVALAAVPELASLQAGEWGTNPVAYGVVALAGVLLVARAGLLRETAVGLGVLLAARWLVETRNPVTLGYGLFQVTLLLYVFFLQNDPRVFPPTCAGRFAFVSLAAAVHVSLAVIFGKRDFVLPASLATASMTIPWWRWEGRTAFRWSPHVDRAMFAAPVALVAALYVSPLNRRANLVASLAEPALTAAPAPAVPAAAPPPSAPSPTPTPAPLSDAYADTWIPGAVLTQPLPPPAPRAALAFRERNILPALPPGRPEDFPTWMYAGVAVGDLDHDGHLDALLYGEGRALGAWLWRRDHFEDATARYFSTPLRDVEMAALADMDGDGWLDVWLVFSQYAGERPGGLWRYTPAEGRFMALPFPKVGLGKRSCGGIALADINRDGVLDAYISYGLDWSSSAPNLHETPSPHELWVSHAGGWKDAWRERMPEEITRTSFAGMTAYFGDLNEDGALDLLIGNDFLDPSLFLTQAATGEFQLAPRRWVEANTIHSMSYLPVDLDGDGVEELVEVGAAPPWAALTRGESSVDTTVSPRLPRHQELKQLVGASSRGKYACAGYKDPTVRWLCAAHLAMERAILKTDLSLCSGVPPGLVHAFCERQVRQMQLENYALPQSVRYDVERFPKQVMDNVVLKRMGPNSGYGLVSQPREVTFTGWSWAAYPEDLDGDGQQDLAITNGFMKTYFHPNRILRNASLPGKPRLEEVTRAAGVGYGDQSRGLVAADFDEDGDADLLIGNQAGEPQYLENTSGGDRVEVELRMKGPNRYAVGATVTLQTSLGPQKRRMAVGGVWNTSQPARVRFSVQERATLSGVEITWPDGQRTRHAAPGTNTRTTYFR